MKASVRERTGRLRKRERDGGIGSVRVGKSRDLSLNSRQILPQPERDQLGATACVVLDS